MRSRNSFRFAALVALVLSAASPQIVLAQVDPDTPAGVQDVAPGGGLTVQDGVTTEATLCPDGSKPELQDAAGDGATTEAADGENKRYLCPDTAATTSGSGVDADESATGTPTPTMK